MSDGSRVVDEKVKELAAEFARFLREDLGYRVDGPPMYTFEGRIEESNYGPLGGTLQRACESKGGIRVVIDVPVTRRGII